ncbi:hypothetical protein CVS40_12792 [Lucilia cuprina]|nr:hypothetical protein CVS40_12792 [Lucilia cuprina]
MLLSLWFLREAAVNQFTGRAIKFYAVIQLHNKTATVLSSLIAALEHNKYWCIFNHKRNILPVKIINKSGYTYTNI